MADKVDSYSMSFLEYQLRITHNCSAEFRAYLYKVSSIQLEDLNLEEAFFLLFFFYLSHFEEINRDRFIFSVCHNAK